MKGQMIATAAMLALFAVAAAPQIAYAQTKTQNVTVVNPTTAPVNARITNQVVPVEVSNANPIPVTSSERITTEPNFVTLHANDFDFTGPPSTVLLDREAVLTNVSIAGSMTDATGGYCSVAVWLFVPANAPFAERPLATFLAFPNTSESLSIPLPNVLMPPGTGIRFLVSKQSNDVDARCQAFTSAIGYYTSN